MIEKRQQKPRILTIGHSNATNPTFRIDFFTVDSHLPGTCTFTGSYTQEGKLGTVAGSWSCTIQSVSNPPHGTFTLSQIEANTNGITSRFLGSDQNCSYDGYFGGFRDVL